VADTSTTETSAAAPTYTATTDDEFDALIEEATLPEKPVRLCVHGNLRREYEEVKARIEERGAERDAERTAAAAAAAGMTNDVRLATRSPEAAPAERDPEQDRLDELAELMRAKAITFVVRAMPSKEYNALVAKHPPRREPNTGRVDPRDYQGFNANTFYPELVRLSIAKPTMTPERWAKLDVKLTDAQFDKLANAAAEVNRRDEDLPF
jgi:hypothetical protein